MHYIRLLFRLEVATVNAVGGETYLLVWHMNGKLEVEHIVDSVPGAREVWLHTACLYLHNLHYM